MNLPPLKDEWIARLPSPQGVAFALTKACRAEHVNLQEISDLVRTDPALGGRLLALANSAASGGRSVIAIDDAVARIGITGVSQVALAFSLIDQYGAGACTHFNYAGFWNQSLLMAAAAKELGAARKLGVPGELFTLGLLAQVGCLALATVFPQEYAALIARDLGREELWAEENRLLGTNHLALSAALMTRWGIPAEEVWPFCRYEDAGHALGTASQESVAPDRAHLASASWQVGKAIAQESVDAVFEREDCLAALEWLALDPEALRGHLVAIESTWHLWLALISR